MAEQEDSWSIWFNRDRPWIGMGDFETVDLIEQSYGPVCPRAGQRVVSSKCRLTMAMEEFTQETSGQLDDHLEIPCTSKGLLCLNHQQQHTTGQCGDYAIKFLCRDFNSSDHDDANNSPFPQFDVRIYIILAVVPIFIFLVRILWAYVFRRRRRQRQGRTASGRRHHRRHGGVGDNMDDDDGSIISALANPPPSYKELFGDTGQNRSSIFAISGRNVPICNQCKESSCSVVKAVRMHGTVPVDANHSSTGTADSNNGGTGTHGTDTSSSNNAEVIVSSSNSNSTHVTMVDIPHNHNVPLESDNAALGVSNSEPSDNNTGTGTQSLDSVHVDVEIESHRVSRGTSEQSEHSDAENSSLTGVIPFTTYIGVDENENDDVEGNNNNSNNNNDNDNDNAVISNTIHTLLDRVSGLDNTSHHPAIQSNQTSSGVQSQPILLPLSVDNDPSPSGSSHCNNISDPCACVCHRTVPCRGRGVKGFSNHGFQLEETPCVHVPSRASLPRAWSNLSMMSSVTVTELPSYQDALELIKKKEAEAITSS